MITTYLGVGEARHFGGGKLPPLKKGWEFEVGRMAPASESKCQFVVHCLWYLSRILTLAPRKNPLPSSLLLRRPSYFSSRAGRVVPKNSFICVSLNKDNGYVGIKWFHFMAFYQLSRSKHLLLYTGCPKSSFLYFISLYFSTIGLGKQIISTKVVSFNIIHYFHTFCAIFWLQYSICVLSR